MYKLHKTRILNTAKEIIKEFIHKLTHIGENGTRPKSERKNETAKIAMHQIRLPTINVQAENQYAKTAERKVISQKFAVSNTESNKKLKKMGNQTIVKRAKLTSQKNIINEIKHATTGKITLPGQ